jgi:hypothetical protein
VRRYIGLDSNGVGRYRSKDIALADDFLDADGEVIFSYAQAQQRAHEWRSSDETDAPSASGPLTVSAAVAKYIASLADNGRPTGDAQSCAAVHILPALGSLLVEDLATDRLRRWQRYGKAARGSAASAARLPLLEPENEETQRQRQSTANEI